MTLYTLHMCGAAGFSTCFETRDLPYDSAAYRAAGDLLEAHASAHYVAVWDGDRPVLCRHRDAPFIRPLAELPLAARAS